MKRVVTIAAVLIAGFSHVTPAGAQSGAGSVTLRWDERVTRAERQHIRSLHVLAACLAQRRPAQLAAVLAAPIGSEEQTRLLNRLGERGDCIRGSIAMTEHAARGAFAEGLLKSRRTASPAASGVERQDFAAFFARHAAASPRGLDEQEEAFVHARYAADCVVARAPAAAATLLATETASPEERAALEALTPTITACAVRPEALFDIGRQPMRGAIAEAAYTRRASPQ